MKRTPVESSDLVAVGYDQPNRVLEIEFKGKRVYHYFEVEPEIYKGLMRAESYGEYFYAFINRHYRYKRVAEAKQGTTQAITFISGNAHKLSYLREACQPYGIEVEALELPIDEIQSDDPEKIAVSKAKQAYKLSGRPVLVMDAFWNILALKGFPGAFMSYMNGWFRAEDFLALMAGKVDRTIGIKETLVYYDGQRSKIFTQDIWGKVTEEPRGKSRLPIREVVILDGDTQTIAELEEQHLSPYASHIEDTIWHDFAKWYNFQRRLKKV